MRIADGVHMLELTTMMPGGEVIIYPTWITDGTNSLLVDTGYPGQMNLIQLELEKSGYGLGQLTHLLFTHQDLDHIGCAPELLRAVNQPVQVMSSELEKPYIEGQRRILRITDESIELAVQSLPANAPDGWKQAFRATLESPPTTLIDQFLQEGQKLPLCGGVTVLGTRGHTPGHVSFYHHKSRTLVAGDALAAKDGQLLGPDPRYALDLPLAEQSIKPLLDYDIDSVICFHGGAVIGGIRARLEQIIDSFQ